MAKQKTKWTRSELKELLSDELKDRVGWLVGGPIAGFLIGGALGWFMSAICHIACPTCGTTNAILIGWAIGGGLVGAVAGIAGFFR